MKTKTMYLQVDARERLPKRDYPLKMTYIIFYKPKGVNVPYTVKTAHYNDIVYLKMEHNGFDVYWLEQEIFDVLENINVDISDKTKLTFNVETHELVKVCDETL